MRIRANDTIKLEFAFIKSGERVNVTSAAADIFDPYQNLVASPSLSATGTTYYCYYTAGSTVGTYFAVGRGQYQNETIYSASQVTFDVVQYFPSALVTLDEVKEYLEIDTSEDDDFLLALINSCSKLILSYLQRGLTVEDNEEKEYVVGISNYFLRSYPVIELTSITVDDSSLTEDDDYYLDYRTGKITFVTRVTGELYVRYRSGFPQIPEPVRLACKKLVSTFYNFRAKEGYARRQIVSYVESFDLESKHNVFREIKPLLDPFRKAVK